MSDSPTPLQLSDDAGISYRGLVSAALLAFTLTMLSVAFVHGATVLFLVACFSFASAACVLRFGGWRPMAAALAVSSAGLIGGLPAFRFGVSHFESAWDFGPAVVATASAGLATAFAAADLLHHLRRRERVTAGRGIAAFAASTATVLLAVVAASFVATISSRETLDAAERLGADPVSMQNTRFTPAVVDAVAGEPQRIAVKNDDPMLHTIAVPDANVKAEVGPGSEKLVEFVFASPGEYDFICDVPGHTAMSGRIIVR